MGEQIRPGCHVNCPVPVLTEDVKQDMKDMEELKKDVKSISDKLPNYIPSAMFMWIVGGVCTVGFLLLTLAYKDVNKAVASVDNSCTSKNIEQDNRIDALHNDLLAMQTDLMEKVSENQQILLRIEKRAR